MTLVLAVDDDPEALGSLRRVLKDAGYEVSTANNGSEALRTLTEKQPDVVILDVIMPEMSGIEVCKHIRSNPFNAKLPIIFLTAKSRPNDIAEGLDAGGDDYIVKPFQVIELPARIRALLRRTFNGVLDTESDELVVGKMALDSHQFKLRIGEREYDLTVVEHRLLHYLMMYAGQPHSVEQLLEHVWDYPPHVGDPALIYSHIKNIRQKIEPEPDSPIYIQNVRGIGYRIASQVNYTNSF